MNRIVNQIRGVTLIEIMMVMVIIGILAGFAGPQFGDLMKKQSLLAESRRITTLLKLARSEARARGGHVVLSHVNGADWSGDLLLFHAVNSTGDRDFIASANPDASNNDEQIRSVGASGRVLSVDSSLPGRFITFTPRGWATQAFTMAICNTGADSTDGRFIQVNRVGKILERPIGNDSCAQ